MKLENKTHKLSWLDKTVVLIHIFICFFLWFSYNNSLFPIDTVKKYIGGYFFILPITVIALLFRRLRNIKYFLIWLIVGLLQMIAYYILKDNPEFFHPIVSPITGLRSLFPVLLLFQILRQISFRLYNKDLIISFSAGRTSIYEEEDNCDMNGLDFISTFILPMISIYFAT
jgi:hypothetical protein